MSKSAALRIADEGAVPLRGSVPSDEKPPSAPVAEEPVPLRLGAERAQEEERIKRLDLIVGRRHGRLRELGAKCRP